MILIIDIRYRYLMNEHRWLWPQYAVNAVLAEVLVSILLAGDG